MYEAKTPEAVRQQILDGYEGPLNTTEGGFASDMAAPIALEVSKAYGAVDFALAVMAIEDEELIELERRAGEYGIPRKPGAKATGSITITGTDGVTIPAGTVATTEDGLRFITDAAVSIAAGTATVGATAAEVGAVYNVAEGQITRFYRNLVGVTGVTNPAKMEDGVDAETKAALRARLLARLQTPATSGNAHHYRQWALETAGVGAAKVTPLWAGPGTVRVLIVGNNGEPVAAGIVADCAAHIDEARPIGASVTVVSATGQNISVTASVEISSTTTLPAVQAAFEAALQAYVKSVAFVDYTISYNRIAYLLMSVEGVIDYTGLLLNGGTANVTIGTDSVPVLAGVTLDAA